MRIQIMLIAVALVLTSGSFASLFGMQRGRPQVLSDQEKQRLMEEFKSVALVSVQGGFQFKTAQEFSSIPDIDNAIQKIDAIFAPGVMTQAQRTSFASGATKLHDALSERKVELQREIVRRAQQEARDADPQALMEDLKSLVEDVEIIISEKYNEEVLKKLEKELADLKASYASKKAELSPLEEEEKRVTKFIKNAKRIETDVDNIRVHLLDIERKAKQ